MVEYSSSSVSGSSLKHNFKMVCHYGVDSPLVTAWTDENPGRRFHDCGKDFVRRKCNFFRWYDPEVPDRQNKIIRGLLRKNDELKKKERSLVIVIGLLGIMLFMCVLLALGLAMK
ncbi:GRF zinc finger protein [Medicago truncatula]|uniref:GRF zinc finger protein n=1 Tax=Medicago truncatula TaxID=3880 RepID=G7L719_MEDTR|nr:GRF zinc finger protein [Medicago truncatula]